MIIIGNLEVIVNNKKYLLKKANIIGKLRLLLNPLYTVLLNVDDFAIEITGKIDGNNFYIYKIKL